MRFFLERTSVLILPALFLFSSGCLGQITARPAINEIVARAVEQRDVYINEFKNLMSQETKTFEVYDKKGDAKAKRSVVSIFIVYQLSKDDRSIAEYRNVISVDGKKLDDTDKRAQEFFEEIAKVDSSKKELEKLDKEGARYDKDISLNLFTLYQSVTLADNLRPYFEFKIEGSEKLGDRDVFIISYQQIKASPYVAMDAKKESVDGKLTLVYDVDFGSGQDLNGRLRGKFWIDAETFQIWKELRTMTIQPAEFSGPLVVAENTFEYHASNFGILTPKKIAYTQFRIDKKSRNARKEAGVTFVYETFTKPDVEVKSADVKN